MDLNQLLAKPAAALFPSSKLPRLQPKPVNRLDQPVIIPLGGSTTTNIINTPLGLFPVQVLNQQLLVPLDAFQTTKESAILPPTPPAGSSSSPLSPSPQSNPLRSEVVIHTQDREGTVRMNLSVALDPSRQQILNQPPVFTPLSLDLSQSSSNSTLLNQNGPVHFAYPLTSEIKKEIMDVPPVTPQELDSMSSDYNTKTARNNRSSRSPSSGLQLGKLPQLQGCISSSSTSMLNEQGLDMNKKTLSSSSNMESKLDAEGLTKIISNLPPGWKVVGLTNLTGTDGVQPTPVVETHDLCSENGNCGNSPSHLSSSSHHRCRVPDVVSVDLNMPTSSTLSSSGILGDTFDSQKMENVLLPINLSSNNAASANKDQKDFSKTVSKNSTVNATNNTNLALKDFPAFSIKKEPDSMHSAGFDMSQNEWRVVGLTSSPLVPQSSSTSQQLPPTIPLPLPVMVASETGTCCTEDRQTNSRSPKTATILNVPSPKLSQHSARSSPPHKRLAPATTSDTRNSSEEMKWTIVGVTVASTIGSSSSLDSVSIKTNNANPGLAKADCAVTNSQQRPVPSTLVSKHAPLPLSSDVNQKSSLDSGLLNDQWKVVGVTQSTNQNQPSNNNSPQQLFPLGYPHHHQLTPMQVSPPSLQPLLVTSISSSASSTAASTTSSSTSSPSTSSLNAVTAAAVSSLSPSSDPLLIPIPPTSLTNPLGSVSPLLNPSSLLPLPLSLPLPLPQDTSSLLEQQQHLLHLLQSQIHLQQQQQQEQRQQFMMNQLSLQNQLPLINALNEWNVVGLLSNVSPALVNANSSTNNSNPLNAINAINAINASLLDSKLLDKAGSHSHRRKVDLGNISQQHADILQDQLVFSGGGGDNKVRNDNNEDGSASYEYNKKSRQSRNKDVATKYTKKNTVSHLLKLKRMKMNDEGGDNSVSLSDQDGDELVDLSLKQGSDKIALFTTRVDKDIRSRPLQSYAGNRRLFSKTFVSVKAAVKEKINLRSGVQIDAPDGVVGEKNIKEEEEEEKESMTNTNTNTNTNEMFKSTQQQQQQACNVSSPQTGTRSAARKRKLKIPRKMIADLDYQPFDSSSDSN